MSEEGEIIGGGIKVKRKNFDSRGRFDKSKLEPLSSRTAVSPSSVVDLDEQMWKSGGGHGLPGEATLGGQASISAERQDGRKSSIMPSQTEAETHSQLQNEIRLSREKMAARVARWKALPEDERSEQIEKFIDTFKKIAQRKANRGADEAGNFFKKLAAQIAEIIDDKIIPGIEPFTKGVLILAFTDLALPPSLSIPLTRIIGEYLSGRIERNFRTGAEKIRYIFGVLDESSTTPEEKGFIAGLRAKFKEMFPDTEVPPAPGDGALDEVTESATAESDDESKEANGIPQEVIGAYIKYLSYGSSGPDAQERALEYFKINPNAIEYSKEVIRMRDEHGEKALFEFADEHLNVLKKFLSDLNLDPSEAASNRSWVLWHAAKLRYLKNNPGIQSRMDNAGQYSPEDPLQALNPDSLTPEELFKSVDANKEMFFVMLGWELYNALHGNEDKVAELLDPNAEFDDVEELMDLIDEEREKGKGSLSSYKLRRLGELAYENFIPSDPAEASGGGGKPPVNPTEAESSAELPKPSNGFMMERADLHRQMNEIRTELFQTGQLRRKPGGGNYTQEDIQDLILKQLKHELQGKEIYTLHRPGGTIYFTEYDVTDRSECEAFGEGSKSIVVMLNLAGLLSNYTDEEVEVIRSFDERHLPDEGMQELFEVYMNDMADKAREAATVGGIVDESERRSGINAGYNNYKETMMSLMYTLISSKVAGEDQDTPSLKIAETIKRRLGELKAVTKFPSFDSAQRNPEGIKINTRTHVAVPTDASMDVPGRRRYGGRTQFVEVDTEMTISEAIKKDLLPTLESIESTVAIANSIRAKTYAEGSLKDLIDTAKNGITLEAVPTAVRHNKYLQFANQEYLRAQAQVNGQVNHIPNSNFGMLIGADKLEEAEILTIEALSIKFPFKPKSKDELKEIFDKKLAEARARHEKEKKLKIKRGEFDVIKETARVNLDIEQDEKRRKARLSMDLELAAKMASGLHKGLGEYWGVMDAMVGDEVLTSYGVDNAPVQDFADFKSRLMPKLMEGAPVEGMRYGQGAGFSAMALPAERFFGRKAKQSNIEAPGLVGKILKKAGGGFSAVRGALNKANTYLDRPATARFRAGDVVDYADAQTTSQVHDMARAIAESERAGCPPELMDWYRKYVTMAQQMRKVPGDLPRSGGWRVDGDDSFDRKFAASFKKEAGDKNLTGLDVHIYVMDQMRALGGERMVMHYISKNIVAISKDVYPGGEIAQVSDRYDILRKKVADNYKTGQHGTPADEADADRTKIELDILKDAAKIDLFDRYVFSPLLERSPEMALLIERRGLTPVGEKTVRQHLVDKLEQDFRVAPEFTYALMYQCIPALEVATRQWNSRPRHSNPTGSEQEQMDNELRLQISSYFKDKIESSGIDLAPGTPSTQLNRLASMLPGDTIDQKVARMNDMFEAYKSELISYTDPNNTGDLRKDGQSLSKRFAEHVVLGLGNADSLMTSAAGFDYSKIQFTGANALASSLGGVETNIKMKEKRNEVFGEEGVLAKAYKSTDTDLRVSKNLIEFASKISAPLLEIARAQSKNPDEVKIIYARLAQMCVFSFKPTQSRSDASQLSESDETFRAGQNRIPGIWTVGETPNVGLELDDQLRYQLMRVLLVQGGIGERRYYVDVKQMDPLTPDQIKLQQKIASASEIKPVILDLGLGDPVTLKSEREELSQKLVRTGKVTEAAITQAHVLGNMFYNSSRIPVVQKPT